MSKPSISFLAGGTRDAERAVKALAKRYGQCRPERADIIVALGGDGFMLETQRAYMNRGIPIYGMNKGAIGFLMNNYLETGLYKRLERAICAKIHPLHMKAIDHKGKVRESKAFNEVSLFRRSHQAAKLQIAVDGSVRMEGLICDGILLATPQGSTAYNLSASGPIVPLHAPLLALTPISPFRPRGWRGALLPNKSRVSIKVLESDKRPVNAVSDQREIQRAREVHIREDRDSFGLIMFDPEQSWEDRILNEQFRH